MPSLIKTLKYFLILLISLLIIVVIVANSSWVIKKVADKFAPEYKISYDDIKGNVLTGVNIVGLKFDGKMLSPSINFSWNPSKILYKRVAINEISVSSLDVGVVKELIASFPASPDDNETSTPLPVVILVNKVHIDVKPFDEQGIHFSKTLLDVKNISFASDSLGIDNLLLNVDTNISKITLDASLDAGKLIVNKLFAENIDSISLENMFIPKEEKESIKQGVKKTGEVVKEDDDDEPLNPFIPREFEVKHLLASVKPRVYKSANISELKVEANNIEANLEKILANEKDTISVAKLTALVDSNVSKFYLSANLKEDTLTIEDLNLKDIDTLALQQLFASDSAATKNDNADENTTTIEENKEQKESKDVNKSENVNNLIPKYIVLKKLSTQIMPTSYDPVDIATLLLFANDIKFNTLSKVVEGGTLDLNATTNLSNITYTGKIKNNQLLGGLVIAPTDELYKLYNLPLNKEAIGSITINIDANKKHVVADVKAEAKQILIVKEADSNSSDENASKAFNLDIDSLLSHVVYTIEDNTLVADSKVKISTPYAKDISITNKFLMDNNMSYNGEIKAAKVIGIDAKLLKPLNNLNIKYDGDLKSVKTAISSEGLIGSFVSSDFKKGKFHLETTEEIELKQLVKLPAELNATKANIFVDVPLDFAKMSTVNGKVKITSNVVNADADIVYEGKAKVKVTTKIPKNSLLLNYDKNIHFSAISPMVTNLEMDDNSIKINIKSSKIKADVLMDTSKKTVEGKIGLAGLTATLNAKPNGDIVIKSDVGSFKTLINSVNQFYKVDDLPKVDGKLSIAAKVDKKSNVELHLSSPKVIYHADRKTDHIIEDVNVVLSSTKSNVFLKSYKLTYDKLKIFANKASEISVDKDIIKIPGLWLNDQLKVTGEFNSKTRKGTILADAPTFHLAHEMIEMDSSIKIKTVLDGNNTDITGKITLLGGDIHYDLNTKTFPSDSDIIIVQDMKKKEANVIMDNLTVAVNVDTKKPLIYRQGPIDIQAMVNLSVHKAKNSELMVLGEVNLLKGGSYTFEEKRFVLERSNIYFTGNPDKPLLDISVKYKSLNHLITIAISGSATTPNILFSSVPSLKKEQILSIILFDSEEGAGSNSGEDMMKMMGGAMAKSALADMGIRLDHLAIGTDGSVEVGKKLTDKITFIYINDIIPQVKVKYQHSPRTESVISADEESESYDIVYKRDFSDDDIVIFGR